MSDGTDDGIVEVEIVDPETGLRTQTLARLPRPMPRPIFGVCDLRLLVEGESGEIGTSTSEKSSSSEVDP